MGDLPHYPPKLTARFPDALASILRRLTTVETRTACIDSGFPLAVLPAVIDSGYASGDPKVYINGSTTLSAKLQYLTSYTPAAGDAVLVVPVGVNQAYVIIGKLSG